jgi:hypothetical protein
LVSGKGDIRRGLGLGLDVVGSCAGFLEGDVVGFVGRCGRRRWAAFDGRGAVAVARARGRLFLLVLSQRVSYAL